MRNELVFQNHIIDSYRTCGGRARKWATELQVGPPDLICSLPTTGLHLMEVKHLPDFGTFDNRVRNPMTLKQVSVAREYVDAGGMVVLGIVGKSQTALGSMLYLFDPLLEYIDTAETTCYTRYRAGIKFDVKICIETYADMKGA